MIAKIKQNSVDTALPRATVRILIELYTRNKNAACFNDFNN